MYVHDLPDPDGDPDPTGRLGVAWPELVSE